LLKNYGITTERTDVNGDVTYETDGTDLQLKTNK
jgi:beta-lactamase superfamily II metal-dependent hydrolase